MEIIKFIQSFSNPFFDVLFQLITMMGEDTFFMLVTAVIYWCVDKKLGYKLGFVTLTSAAVNFGLKDIFKIPRPIGEPGIRSLRVETAGGYSFPSGHTQNTATLWTFFMTQFRRKWLYAAGVVMIALVGLSRLYLGVHTPLDVAGGIVIGAVWVFIWNYIYELSIKNKSRLVLIAVVLLSLAGLSVFSDPNYYKAVGALTGLLTGYYTETRFINFSEKAALPLQLLKVILGLLTVYILRVLLKGILPAVPISDFIRYLLLLLWITVVTPLIIKRFIPE